MEGVHLRELYSRQQAECGRKCDVHRSYSFENAPGSVSTVCEVRVDDSERDMVRLCRSPGLKGASDGQGLRR